MICIYRIYKIVCTVNNKVYIGCTTKSIYRRFKEHIQSSKNKNKHSFLYDDMSKYGADCFYVELVEEGTDDSCRYEREKYYINLYNTRNESIGYNMTIGGLGTIGYKFTDEAREKISAAGIGRVVPQDVRDKISKKQIGKKLTEETKRKISISRLGKFTGEKNPYYGKHHTAQENAKATQTKKEHGVLRAVIGANIKTGEIVKFDSIADASRYCMQFHKGKYSTMLSHIHNSILGKYGSKSAYGFRWSYIEKSNDYPGRE